MNDLADVDYYVTSYISKEEVKKHLLRTMRYVVGKEKLIKIHYHAKTDVCQDIFGCEEFRS